MEEEERGCFHEASFVSDDGCTRTIRVPVVQELSRQGLSQLPDRFIQVPPGLRAERAPVNPAYETLQSIDMAKLRDGSKQEGRAEELAKLARAMEEQGMFLIEDHGIGTDVQNAVKGVVKEFFVLSFQEKKASVGSYMNVDNMGYGRNFVKSEDQPLDWIDRLTMKASPKGATEGLHVWPIKPPNFRQVVETYVHQAREVLDRILESLAESLSLEKHAFLQNFDPDSSEINVRINCYPPCPKPDMALGLTPHTDASALTLLMQIDSSGGLQVLRGQDWRTVEWPTDKLLVSAGDVLEIMSNGRVESPWHRVVPRLDAERLSIVLFYNPPPEAEIVPVRRSGIDYKGRYRRVVVADYCQHLYKISPTIEKEAILYAIEEHEP